MEGKKVGPLFFTSVALVLVGGLLLLDSYYAQQAIYAVFARVSLEAAERMVSLQAPRIKLGMLFVCGGIVLALVAAYYSQGGMREWFEMLSAILPLRRAKVGKALRWVGGTVALVSLSFLLFAVAIGEEGEQGEIFLGIQGFLVGCLLFALGSFLMGKRRAKSNIIEEEVKPLPATRQCISRFCANVRLQEEGVVVEIVGILQRVRWRCSNCHQGYEEERRP